MYLSEKQYAISGNTFARCDWRVEASVLGSNLSCYIWIQLLNFQHQCHGAKFFYHVSVLSSISFVAQNILKFQFSLNLSIYL